MKKEYLGDSVYAQITTFGELCLTTENGSAATNTIILEPEVLQALLDYVKRHDTRGKEPKGSDSQKHAREI